MNDSYNDIICARATAAGSSAIAIIRVSGKNCLTVLEKIFISKYKKQSSFTSHKAYYGTIQDNNKILDDVLVIPFAEGKSFTGEESFEINCHGGETVIQLIIRLLLNNDVRLAEPGEFSKRAFLNGRIDLTEAEAIMDIVNASTKQAALIAVGQLTGSVKTQIDNIKDKISELLAEIEVYIDYPEEDLSLPTNQWVETAKQLHSETEKTLDGFNRGKYIREGVKAVLLGKTNAGKSTLFNFLLNEDKAIVSDIHGTTRDYLDGIININGFGIRIFDTAGLRKTLDPIELEGTKRSIKLSEHSDIILYLIPADKGLTDEDIENINLLSSESKVLFIITKTDVENELSEQIIKSIHSIVNNRFQKYSISCISALHKKGLAELNNSITGLIDETHTDSTDPLITNERHAIHIRLTLELLQAAIDRLNEDALDLAAFDIRQALNELGQITGEVTPDDILNKIFSGFCVGK